MKVNTNLLNLVRQILQAKSDEEFYHENLGKTSLDIVFIKYEVERLTKLAVSDILSNMPPPIHSNLPLVQNKMHQWRNKQAEETLSGILKLFIQE